MTAEGLLAAAVEASREIGHLFGFIATADDEPGLLVGTFIDGQDPPADAFIGMDCGALGVRVSWSPDERPTIPCWAITAVSRGLPAEVAVGPYEGVWWRLVAADLPWFLASTAGGIRSSIEKGEPLVFKRAADPHLFDRVANMNPPPTDERGRI